MLINNYLANASRRIDELGQGLGICYEQVRVTKAIKFPTHADFLHKPQNLNAFFQQSLKMNSLPSGILRKGRTIQFLPGWTVLATDLGLHMPMERLEVLFPVILLRCTTP